LENLGRDMPPYARLGHVIRGSARLGKLVQIRTGYSRFCKGASVYAMFIHIRPG